MSEAEIFHQGEGLVLPAPLMFCQRQTEWNDGPSTQMEEMAFGVFVLQTHSGALTCMVGETLERDRPSRSDRRLEETNPDFGVLFTGVGETEEHKGKQPKNQEKHWRQWTKTQQKKKDKIKFV